jgi:hypothetical protein
VVLVPCLRPRKPTTSLREIEHNLLVLSVFASWIQLWGQCLAQIGCVNFKQ